MVESTLEGQLWRLAKRFQIKQIRALVAPLINSSEA
jgi:hypothetical protein